MITLRIELLGRFGMHEASGATLGPLGRKAQALVAILALSPGSPMHRDRLAALLWSDRGDSQARGSLRHALAELRKALADLEPEPLVVDRDIIRIDPDVVEVDAVTFERLRQQSTLAALTTAASDRQNCQICQSQKPENVRFSD